MVEELVSQIETSFKELEEQMSDPEVIADRERYAEVGRAYRQLQAAAELARQWRAATDDAAVAEELLDQDGDDADTRRELSRPASAPRSSKRRSASRWSNATPTTTRT